MNILIKRVLPTLTKDQKLVYGYIAMYSDTINSNLEIQVFKYMRIHRTSKMHST